MPGRGVSGVVAPPQERQDDHSVRPSDKPTGAVWALLASWSSRHALRPNQSQMAGLFEVSTSLMSDWKYMRSAMQTDDMLRVCESTGIPFVDLAEAVSLDSPTVSVHVSERRTGRVSSGQQRRRDVDQAGEPTPDNPDDMESR